MTAELGSLFQFIRNGMNIKQDKSSAGIPITRIETISNATVDASKVGYAGLSEQACVGWLLEPGDILFSHINSVEHLGKCAVYRGHPAKLAHGMNLLCFRSDPTKLQPEFAKYLFRDGGFRSQLAKSVKKAVNQASVSIGDLKSIRVTLPSVEEQVRIAAILDQADALRAKRRAALAQLDEMAQAIFVEMFGDGVENVPWPSGNLGELCDLVRGSSPRPQGDLRYFGGPVPRLMIADITRDGMLVQPKIDSLTLEGAKRSRPMPAGSVVMAVSGAVGLPAILKVDACIHDGFVGFRNLSPQVTPRFLYYLLQFERGRNSARGTGAIWVNLTTEQVSRLRIPLAPLELQERFKNRLDGLENLRAMHQTAAQELEFLFATLQHRAFRGEL